MKGQVKSVDSVEYLRRGVDGKVQKKSKKEEKESAEIKAYLTKLQELVPFTPKNKKLSKMEVIFNVIDYIQDLRETLGLPSSPCQDGSDNLDEQFTWTLMDPSSPSSSSAVPEDDLCEHDEDVVPASPATLTAATITMTSSLNTSSPANFQHVNNRQPLCVISNPRGNTQSTSSHLNTSTNLVKSSLILTSASSNSDH